MNIKKILTLILAIILAFSTLTVLFACKDKKNDKYYSEDYPGMLAPGHGEAFENIDTEGFPEEIIKTWEEYNALEKSAREEYRKSFESKTDFVRWYQEAYRATGRAGSLESKPGYMKDFNKKGFPPTVLTYEEYSFADWRVQDDYVYSFENTDAFFNWYNEAKRIYESEQDYEEVDGSGDIDMSK